MHLLSKTVCRRNDGIRISENTARSEYKYIFRPVSHEVRPLSGAQLLLLCVYEKMRKCMKVKCCCSVYESCNFQVDDVILLVL
jgi:hypothetical protein